MTDREVDPGSTIAAHADDRNGNPDSALLAGLPNRGDHTAEGPGQPAVGPSYGWWPFWRAVVGHKSGALRLSLGSCVLS